MSSLALKFLTLLVRTLAKPVAQAIKALAQRNEPFRKGCIAMAQFVHKADAHMRMKLLGEKKFKVRPLNDKKAIELGATFLLELFIFSVAFGLVVYETVRSRKKATTQREALADDIEVLQGEMNHIKKKLKELNIIVDDYKVPPGYRPKYIKVTDEDQGDEPKDPLKEPEALAVVKVESGKNPETTVTVAKDTTTPSPSLALSLDLTD